MDADMPQATSLGGAIANSLSKISFKEGQENEYFPHNRVEEEVQRALPDRKTLKGLVQMIKDRIARVASGPQEFISNFFRVGFVLDFGESRRQQPKLTKESKLMKESKGTIARGKPTQNFIFDLQSHSEKETLLTARIGEEEK